jgi:hypothetical protein
MDDLMIVCAGKYGCACALFYVAPATRNRIKDGPTKTNMDVAIWHQHQRADVM